MELTQDKVKELFEYRDGALFWKNKTVDSLGRSLKRFNGKPTGCLDSSGYLQTKINGKLHLNHRIIYLMFHGHLPKVLDHINSDRTDNHIENLRPATVSQNNHNSICRKDNTSGYKNVSWHKRFQKWMVRIDANKQTKYVGYFKDLELADLVAQEARDKFHKEYVNHG
jgi:hypothetical protein